MFSCFLEQVADEDKPKVLEKLCDCLEASREDVVKLLQQQYHRKEPKEVFIEKVGKLFESYSKLKIDIKQPFLEEAQVIGGLCDHDKQILINYKHALEITVIIAEQIRLRNYSLEYVEKIPEKLQIYINIHARRNGFPGLLYVVLANNFYRLLRKNSFPSRGNPGLPYIMASLAHEITQ